MHLVVFYFIYKYLFELENKKRPAFCVYKVRLNPHLVPTFTYLKVARTSLGGAMEQLPVLRT